jgi:F0F1-type ATP synthase assembly protein I
VQRLGPAVQLLGLGSYIATCVAGGPIAGHFIDRWLDTEPWFTMGGLALGLIVGFWGSYRMITRTLADMSRWQARQAKKKQQ